MTLTFVSGAAVEKFFRTPCSPVLTIAERTSAADQPGCCWRTMAAEPAKCGVAIDVPWKNAKQGGAAQNACGIELSTLTPGATTSGLTRKSTSVGPWLLKPAMMSELVVWKYDLAAPIVALSPLSATSAVLSASDAIYAGIVGSLAMPPRPIAVGSPTTLFTTMAAIAPASCELRIFSEKVHAPREIRAICPVKLPAAGLPSPAVHALLSFPAALRTTPRLAVRSELTVAKSPAATPKVDPPTVSGEPMK